MSDRLARFAVSVAESFASLKSSFEASIILADRFQQRMQAFKQYLKHRPEDTLGVVAHHGVLHELTGKDFK